MRSSNHRQVHDSVIIKVFATSFKSEFSIPVFQLGLSAEMNLNVRAAHKNSLLHQRSGQSSTPCFRLRSNTADMRVFTVNIKNSYGAQ